MNATLYTMTDIVSVLSTDENKNELMIYKTFSRKYNC